MTSSPDWPVVFAFTCFIFLAGVVITPDQNIRSICGVALIISWIGLGLTWLYEVRKRP